MTVDADMVHLHFETDLDDDALELLIADASEAIEARFGVAGERTEVKFPKGNAIFLDRPAAAVDDVVEVASETSSLTLDADDFEVLNGGHVIFRKVNGTNPAYGWASRVEVTYTPRADEARRDRVVLDLVKLAAQYSGLTSETGGDYEATLPEYQRERDRVLSELGRGLVRFS